MDGSLCRLDKKSLLRLVLRQRPWDHPHDADVICQMMAIISKTVPPHMPCKSWELTRLQTSQPLW